MIHSTVRFKKVTIENFISIGNVEDLPLDVEGVTLVTGQNLDDPKSDSNGSGKSSIFYAVL